MQPINIGRKPIVLLSVVVGALALTVFFQNCSPQGFNSAGLQTGAAGSTTNMASTAVIGRSVASTTLVNTSGAGNVSVSDAPGIAVATPGLNACSYTWAISIYSLRTSGGGSTGLPVCNAEKAPTTLQSTQYANLHCVVPPDNCDPKDPAPLFLPINIHFSKDGRTKSHFFQANEQIYIQVSNVGTDNAICIETEGSNDNCIDASRFKTISASDNKDSLGFSYNGYSNVLAAMQKVPAALAGKSFRVYWYNKKLGVRSYPYHFSVASGPGIPEPAKGTTCGWGSNTFVAGPCAGNRKVCNQQFVGTTEIISCGTDVVSTCTCK